MAKLEGYKLTNCSKVITHSPSIFGDRTYVNCPDPYEKVYEAVVEGVNYGAFDDLSEAVQEILEHVENTMWKPGAKIEALPWSRMGWGGGCTEREDKLYVHIDSEMTVKEIYNKILDIWKGKYVVFTWEPYEHRYIAL